MFSEYKKYNFFYKTISIDLDLFYGPWDKIQRTHLTD